jgi:hypothetical protein
VVVAVVLEGVPVGFGFGLIVDAAVIAGGLIGKG